MDACEAACGALRSPVVYCHNDLLAPNVLLSTSEAAPGELYLIDFEYGSYNYRGFDLGNHFNEWAGFDCEYWRYPDDAQQRAFLAAYAGGEAGPAPAAHSPEVDALVVEANVFSLASHLYWGIWALIQAKCVLACRLSNLGLLCWAAARRAMPCRESSLLFADLFFVVRPGIRPLTSITWTTTRCAWRSTGAGATPCWQPCHAEACPGGSAERCSAVAAPASDAGRMHAAAALFKLSGIAPCAASKWP